MYSVCKEFTDMKDNGYKYSAGDAYPRTGYIPDAKRIAELTSNSNRIGEPLIAEVTQELPESTEEEKLRRGRPPKRGVRADDDGNLRTAK